MASAPKMNRLAESSGSSVCDECAKGNTTQGMAHNAVMSMHHACLNALIQQGADVKSIILFIMRNQECLETRAGSDQCIEMFINAVADVNEVISDGKVLTHVARSGFTKCVQLLIKRGADVNMRDKSGRTALREAIRGKHDTCVELLLQAGADVTSVNLFTISSDQCLEMLINAGADVNHVGSDRKTVLMHAAEKGYVNSVELMVKEGADVKSIQLPCVMKRDDPKYVELLINAGADVNEEADGFDRCSSYDDDGDDDDDDVYYIKRRDYATALILAAKKGYDKTMEVLIKAGAELDQQCKEITALMWTVWYGRYECAELLVQAGADVNVRDPNGETVLIVAMKKHYSQFVELFIKAGAELGDALARAARNGQDQYLRLIIEAGANLKDDGGDALYWAAARGKTKCMELLIEAGVNEWCTALRTATDGGYDKCVKLLIEAGADVNDQHRFNKKTSLLEAARSGHDKCIELLIEAGADVNIQNKNGDTALVEAARGGYDKCVELLIVAGADVNGDDGKTSLMKAAQCGHNKCLDLLIKTGVNMNAMNEYDERALMLAAGKGHDKCVEMLVKAGADVNVTNANGKNVLMLALEGIVDKQIKTNIHTNIHEYNRCKELQERAKHDRCIELLVSAGINLDAQLSFWGSSSDTLKLLMAAGYDIRRYGQRAKHIMKELVPEPEIHLKNICREAIRKHLLKINPKGNMFVRVPKLPLPKALQSYLLYDQILDDVAEETDESSAEPEFALK